MAYNQFQKLKDNLQAIRVSLQHKQGTELSVSDNAALQRYSGFGGIKTILYPDGAKDEWIKLGATQDDMRMYQPMREFHELLRTNYSPDEYQAIVSSLKENTLTAFFTPDIIPRTLYEALSQQGINPRRLYEPSAGAGVFITEAVNKLPSLEQVTAVEKDILTAQVLSAINSTLGIKATTHALGLEKAPTDDNHQYDLVVSNIPFGNFSVFDPEYPDKSLSGRIHNYFFAKGLDKMADGGLMAYITTDGFMNSPGNRAARRYLFERADFISLTVMPDNLMKDTGGTEAPSHLLLVQRNSQKSQLSELEEALLFPKAQSGPYGDYTVSSYILDNPSVILGNETRQGKNQYGAPVLEVWQNGDINQVGAPLLSILTRDIAERLDKERFLAAIQPVVEVAEIQQAGFTFLPVPQPPAVAASTVQMGLFDIAPVENSNRAMAYLRDQDATLVSRESAKIVSTIKTHERPDHETIALLAAKEKRFNRYVFRLVSNVSEISFPGDWMNSEGLASELRFLSKKLKQFSYSYSYSGDLTYKTAFDIDSDDRKLYQELKPFYKDNTLLIINGRIGLVKTINHDQQKASFEVFNEPYKHKLFYERYIHLRDTYYDLVQQEASGDEQPALRNDLNGSYDEFKKLYGPLNSPANKKLLFNDEAFGLVVASSLERRDNDQYVKADILSHTISNEAAPIKTDNPVEALSLCLNERGRVDLEYITKVCGLEGDPLLQSLASFIHLDPETKRWQTADEYLSGNVVAKLAIAEMAAAEEPTNRHLRASLDALREVQPDKIPFELLDFNFGERWIPLSFYTRFATDLFRVDTAIHHLPSIDVFRVQPASDNIAITQEFAILPKSGKTMYGYTLMEHALENTAPFFTYTVKDGDSERRLPDNDATQLAHEKIETMRQRFTAWLQELPDTEKKMLEKLYNDTYNCYVLRQFKGDHLTFPGLDMEGLKSMRVTEIYSSQRDAAWRIIQERGALVDHEVGLGKTLTAILANQEMRRLGIIKKPLLLGLKANVTDLARTYRTAYPKARVLAPGKDDFTPRQRQRIYNEIMNNDWDCIILTHDQFKKIPQSPQMQRTILEEEVDNLSRDLQTLEDIGGDVSKKMLKGLEIRKKNLDSNLSQIMRSIETQKDTDIDFQKLGIDFIQIDESHKFKNLTFTTRHNRVAGLGNSEGSQKALNMLFAIRTLQERNNSDLCVTFLSGTPISNSLTEMYLIFKYLRPRELAKQHILNFDAWASVFARKTTEFEFSITNQIIAKERFRHFIKVPELAMFYNQITDYKTAKHINLRKPELEEHLVNIKPTPDQQAFMKQLMEYARTGNNEVIGRIPKSDKEDDSRMLIATDYAKKMAADMRLISPSYSDHPDCKVNVCARKVAEWYHLSAAHLGTQIVFSDIGTPKPGSFNLYDTLKEKLVADFDIPATHITFIHDWTDDKKPELFRKMNAGEIRVLVGSTEKAGTGLNVQQRVVAMHHLDIPWKPSELEQRNGRGARQNNWVAEKHFDNKVRNFIYAVEQTLDNYKFNLLKNKQTFISQLKNCDLHVRTIDEGAFDEKTGMNFAEYIAILSGDTSLLEKTKLEKKIASLENLKSAFLRETSRARHRHEDLLKKKDTTTGLIDKFSRDQETYHKHLTLDKEGTKINSIRLVDESLADPEAIGKYLIKLYHTYAENSTDSAQQLIATVNGFDCYIRAENVYDFDTKKVLSQRTFFAKSPETGLRYYYNQGHINTDNPKLAARHFLNAIDRVDYALDTEKEYLAKIEKELPQVEALTHKTFEREEDMKKLKDELAKLEREISIRIKEQQMQTEAAPAVAPDKDAPALPPGIAPDVPTNPDTALKKVANIRYLPDLGTTEAMQARM